LALESPDSSYGLKEDWNSVQKTLEQIIPIYDRTNRFISLGTDLKLRKTGIEILLNELKTEDFSLLDLGCGTGTMTLLFQAAAKSNDRVTLVDPLVGMMRIAHQKVGQDGALGVYEFLPFRKDAVDAVMAGFSIRDARDLSAALRQINILLKENGKFLIVDLSKPDSPLKSGLISVYWRVLAPAIAFLSSGKLGLKFGALAKTYKRLPKISEFFRLSEAEGFEVTKSEFSMLGGACVILLTKRYQLTS
jgi:demethylmenaquinone methyltransferase / 2-methoxy-6-polyprenyl-1,4-benzoquinol methylase